MKGMVIVFCDLFIYFVIVYLRLFVFLMVFGDDIYEFFLKFGFWNVSISIFLVFFKKDNFGDFFLEFID